LIFLKIGRWIFYKNGWWIFRKLVGDFPQAVGGFSPNSFVDFSQTTLVGFFKNYEKGLNWEVRRGGGRVNPKTPKMPVLESMHWG
jgi:hypothetical protein